MCFHAGGFGCVNRVKAALRFGFAIGGDQEHLVDARAGFGQPFAGFQVACDALDAVGEFREVVGRAAQGTNGGAFGEQAGNGGAPDIAGGADYENRHDQNPYAFQSLQATILCAGRRLASDKCHQRRWLTTVVPGESTGR